MADLLLPLTQRYQALTRREQLIILAAIPVVIVMLAYATVAPLLREQQRLEVELNTALDDYVWLRQQAPLIAQFDQSCAGKKIVKNEREMTRYFRGSGINVSVTSQPKQGQWYLSVDKVDDTRLFAVLSGFSCSGLVLDNIKLVNNAVLGAVKGTLSVSLVATP